MKKNPQLIPRNNFLAEALREADFATVNEKDFRDFGFKRVWNPLAED